MERLKGKEQGRGKKPEGSVCASSKGYAIRQVEILSNKLCVAYNKSTRYRRQNSPVSEREFLKIGKGHVEAK